jgi:hypothetical protein
MQKFEGKLVNFTQDKTVGSGIKAVINDSVMDLTILGYLNETISKLKGTL